MLLRKKKSVFVQEIAESIALLSETMYLFLISMNPNFDYIPNNG